MVCIDKNNPFTYAQLKKYMLDLEKEYPFLDLFSLGQSVLGRELFCIRCGKGKFRVFINGAHHGSEWITALMLTEFIRELSFAVTNKECLEGIDIKELLEKVSFYICPMVNPDGVNLSICGITSDIPQKIREKLIIYNNESTDFFGKWQANARGVDLNHNYSAGFYEGKKMEKQLNIYRPGPTRFSGNSPESEPEVLAMVKFTRMLNPGIAIAYHTQGEEIYYTYMGKESKKSREIGEKMAELSGYTLSEPDGMASFSGYKDWVIDELGIPAYTIEAGKGKNPLPLLDFDDIYCKNRRLLLGLFTDCLQNKH